MKSLLSRRPSPAMIIALVALFVSLSGVSYGVATGFIDSREIKNNEVRSIDIRNNEVRTRDLRNNEVRGIDIRNSTVRGRDVGLNSLTGDDLNESTLGKVPSATSADTADSATTAGSASSVTGVSFQKLSYTAQVGSGFQQFASFGGLTLEASCDNAGTPALVVQASTNTANSEISSQFPVFGANNDDDFDPGDDFVIIDNGNGVGQVVYTAPGGTTVTIEALARQDADDVLGTANDCGFFGLARAS